MIYSSDQKLAAAHALNENHNKVDSIKELFKFKGELTNGELGLIRQGLKIKL